jgi:2-oxoglutarate ferredoxin oxidoreductase subunit beta
LIRTLKKAMEHKGFAFVEVLSPCPTQFGRRNAFRTPFAMLQALKENSISVEKAKHLNPAELQDRIIVGEFVNQGNKGSSI